MENNLIYLILSINNNILDESKLNVYLNKTKIKLKQKIIKDKYEPTEPINILLKKFAEYNDLFNRNLLTRFILLNRFSRYRFISSD